MPGLDWQSIESAKLACDPFDHIAIAQAIEHDCASRLPAEYPQIRSAGSFSLDDIRAGPALAGLVADFRSERFRTEMERMFGMNLEKHPALVTLRGQCSPRDGRIHTDSKSKILSVLLYLNDGWSSGDGQLRLLRNGADLGSAAVEIPATMGSLVAFRRCDNSWHGHSLFVGSRRVLQLSYVRTERTSLVSILRHRPSALSKLPVG